MISEGACDTVDWSNSWSNEDLVLPSQQWITFNKY